MKSLLVNRVGTFEKVFCVRLFFRGIVKVKSLSIVIVFICYALLSDAILYAQSYGRISTYEQDLYKEKVFVHGDYQTMANIKSFWVDVVIHRLKSNVRKYDFSLTGNSDGVLQVTIPTSILFHSGEATLTGHADGYLYPFVRYLKGSNALATLIIACHTDNNGSDAYLESFSRERAAAVEAWFGRQSVLAYNMASFGIADHASLSENVSLASREKNRRITLYLVPNKHMLKLAKKGKLNSALK